MIVVSVLLIIGGVGFSIYLTLAMIYGAIKELIGA